MLAAGSTLVWFVGLPLAALTAFVWKTDPMIPFFILRLEYPLKGVVCFIRYATGKWIKVITAKARRRKHENVALTGSEGQETDDEGSRRS